MITGPKPGISRKASAPGADATNACCAASVATCQCAKWAANWVRALACPAIPDGVAIGGHERLSPFPADAMRGRLEPPCHEVLNGIRHHVRRPGHGVEHPQGGQASPRFEEPPKFGGIDIQPPLNAIGPTKDVRLLLASRHRQCGQFAPNALPGGPGHVPPFGHCPGNHPRILGVVFGGRAGVGCFEFVRVQGLTQMTVTPGCWRSQCASGNP
jgi:hypothetical protein